MKGKEGELECSVLRCDREVYGVGICDKCNELLQKKEEYMPLVCWECGTIVDIYEKLAYMDTIFSRGCRECSEIGKEKDTFIVKEPKSH